MKEYNRSDRIFIHILKIPSIALIFLLLAIAYELYMGSRASISASGFGFLTNSVWDPVQNNYGALPVVFGTIVSSFVALLLATPLSIGIALFLTQIAKGKIAQIIGFLVEMLAAIPSVVYGLWGIFVLAPLLRTTVEPFLAKYLGFLPLFQGPAYGVGMLCAATILAIMIVPTIASITREIFNSIPKNQTEAALAIGATRWEMMKMSIIAASKRGIIGAVMLGLGRALGETMAVTMVIGNRHEIAASLFAPSATMASIIANEYAEAVSDIHLSALMQIGFLLFVITFVINSIARLFISRGFRW